MLEIQNFHMAKEGKKKTNKNENLLGNDFKNILMGR